MSEPQNPYERCEQGAECCTKGCPNFKPVTEHRRTGLYCWCNPKILRYRNADVVIHNEGDDA